MAKRISDTEWEPGFIYRLCFQDGADFVPFYVGESWQPKVREEQHRRAGKSEDERLVYEAIREMDAAGITWRMEIVAEYGSEGPQALEDEWVLRTLYAGYSLTNMKKGNRHWMETKEAEAKEMRQLGIDDPRKYKAHKKAELMKAEGIEVEAAEIALVSSSRRKVDPAVEKVRARTEKWSVEKIEAQIEKMKSAKSKGSKASFENKLRPWETVLCERLKIV